MILPSLVVAASLAAGPTFVIPPGEENLTLSMVMVAPAPEGCHLDDAHTVSDHVEVKYVCDTGDRTFQLRHKDDPAAAGAGVIRTEQFAIVPGTPPPPKEILDGVERQVRANEGKFVWVSGAPRADSEQPTATPMTPEEMQRLNAVAQQYIAAFKLYTEGQHKQAYDAFVEMAKTSPKFPGVLGMVVANLAPQQPDAAMVKQLQADADAHPDDPLKQFIAGTGSHYSAHYTARTREEKQALYRQAIHYLERARPAYDFEPRVFIYLAVSHFRLGEQKLAEELVEKAIALKTDDPDTYYCRAEILQRSNPDQALADIQKYLELTQKFAKMGSPVPEGKLERVHRMQAQLEARKRGENPTTELWDPLSADNVTSDGEAMTRAKVERAFPRILLGAAAVALVAVAAVMFRRRKKTP